MSGATGDWIELSACQSLAIQSTAEMMMWIVMALCVGVIAGVLSRGERLALPPTEAAIQAGIGLSTLLDGHDAKRLFMFVAERKGPSEFSNRARS